MAVPVVRGGGTRGGGARRPGTGRTTGERTTTFAHAEEHPHQEVPSDLALRVKSLESLLVEKGLVDRAAIDAMNKVIGK